MTGPSDRAPIAYILGQRGEQLLAMTGWVQEMPDGDGAHLLLHPIGHGVADRMAALGQALGLAEGGDWMPAVDPDVALVEIEDDQVHLRYGGQWWLTRPVTPDWQAAARARGQVALWVGRDGATLTTTRDVDRYMDRAQTRGRLHYGLLDLCTGD